MSDSADTAFERSQVSPWSTKAKLGRAIWMLLRLPLFRLSWHNWYGYRRAVLRLFGAKIGMGCAVRSTAHIEIPWLLEMGDFATLGDRSIVYNLGKITIGKRVTVSQHAHLCAGSHDFSRRDMPLLRLPITIEDDVWIAAQAFVGPGLTIGQGAIVGARACVFKNVPAWEIWGGNPAKKLRDRARPIDD